MATPGNDFIPVQATDPSILTGGAGNDTYIISQFTLAGRTTPVTLSDTQGTNKIQLVDGLQITASMVVANAAQLTVTNGSETFTININGADNFIYEPGGNILAGQTGTEQNYQQFVTDTLQIAAIPDGEVANGGAVTIGAPTPGGNVVDLPVPATQTITAQDGAETFALDLATAFASGPNTQLALAQFAVGEDRLRFDAPAGTTPGTITLDQLDGMDLGSGVVAVQSNAITGNILINFGLDANGDAVSLTLNGITDASSIDVLLA